MLARMGPSERDECDAESTSGSGGSQIPLAPNSAWAGVAIGPVQARIGPDGMPVLGGLVPLPPEGLTEDNFVCSSAPAGRSTCRHLAQILRDAEGQFRGAPAPILRLYRYCRALAAQSELMELSEVEVYACSLRDPIDPASAAKIELFEARQRALAERAATRELFLEM